MTQEKSSGLSAFTQLLRRIRAEQHKADTQATGSRRQRALREFVQHFRGVTLL